MIYKLKYIRMPLSESAMLRVPAISSSTAPGTTRKAWTSNESSRKAPAEEGVVAHPSEANDTVAVDWKGIIPNASGEISVLINAADTDNIGAVALNFASISTSVPEPSSCLLLGLAGLGLATRRKRSFASLSIPQFPFVGLRDFCVLL